MPRGGEIVLGGVGAAVAEREIVFAGAALVGMALDGDPDAGIAGQPGGLGVERRPVAVVEVDSGRCRRRPGRRRGRRRRKSSREPGSAAPPTVPSGVVRAPSVAGGGVAPAAPAAAAWGAFLPQPAVSASADGDRGDFQGVALIFTCSPSCRILQGQDRAPGRVRAVQRGRDPALVAPPVRSTCQTLDLPPRPWLVGRIGRTRPLGDQLGASSCQLSVRSRSPEPSGAHHADPEIAGDAGEGDEVAARAPSGRRVAAAAEADPALVGAVGVHHVELLACRSGRSRRRSGCRRANSCRRCRSRASWSAAAACRPAPGPGRCRYCRRPPSRRGSSGRRARSAARRSGWR